MSLTVGEFIVSLLFLPSPTGGLDASGGLDATAVTLGVMSLVAATTTAYFAFRGKRVNPLENGMAFLSTEAKEWAIFYRDDAVAAREEQRTERIASDAREEVLRDIVRVLREENHQLRADAAGNQ